MLKRACLAGLVLSASALGAAQAADRATKEEAVAMVQKAVAEIKATGTEPIYQSIIAKDPRFVDRDLYVVVFGMDGKVLAHGSNAKMVGKMMLDAEDVDGKPYIKERVDLAREKDNFWQQYKFVDPLSKKIEPKEMYCQKLQQTIVCGGVYKL
jgi:cytochrome c